MGFHHALKLPQVPPVPYYRRAIILLLLCSLLPSFSQAKSCKCPTTSGSDQDPTNMYPPLSSTFDQLQGSLFSANSSSTFYLFSANSANSSSTFLADLGFYKKQYLASKLNLSESGLFVIDDPWILWETSADGTVHEASFNVVFTMSIYQPEKQNMLVSDNNNSLIFAIIPEDFLYSNESVGPQLYNCSRDSTSEPIVNTVILAGNKFTIWTGEFVNQMTLNDTGLCVQTDIESSGDPSMTNYSISIQYNAPGHNMTVQVSVLTGEDQGEQSRLINFSNISSSSSGIFSYPISSSSSFFSFYSTMGQLFQLHAWNSTVERLPDDMENSAKKKGATFILPSVLGSAAVTVATAAVVYFYFNSKYRWWKKELDQLAKTMQLLPGVPTQFSFSDIRRATNNFHETTRLGRGGFGTVYRCKLSTPKRRQKLEVAVKMFSRDDNRRYEDFLAEVSVINRLRHKNIVPLVGWSYNKGQPLLIYEYMPNGSLDQHLFGRSGGKHQQPTQFSMWGTRYNMVKDIATGLHYVHHEYEPRVLHRDIKANNIMIDSTFQGRLGDFGLACVVAEGKDSYTDIGAPGTLGFRAPEYVQNGKATTKSDIFAFGVLILEIVTGKVAVDAQYRHITDRVWHLHKEGRLLDAIDPTLTTEVDASDAKRLLLLGLACSHPNPSDRPTMVEAMQIITKSEPPPVVPLEKPRFVTPLEEELSLSTESTELSSLGSSLTIGIEMTSGGQASSSENGGSSLPHRPIAGPPQELFSIYHTAE